jgi:hypothetical protein
LFFDLLVLRDKTAHPTPSFLKLDTLPMTAPAITPALVAKHKLTPDGCAVS